MLEGKCVVIGVTGSIAAYKSADLASRLKKLGADVHVIMTKNATEFIAPLTFETLTGNKCLVDTFDRDFRFDVTHIEIAKAADLMVIAPASANYIAKAAAGIADDMLTTVTLAATCRKLVFPAMNTHMLENAVTQRNIETLKEYGFFVAESAEGLLACGDTGKGKMPEPADIAEYVMRELYAEKDMKGMKVVVTAGPTQEAIDPVRYITNHSSGKMGYAIARVCMLRGADVELVTGRTMLQPPPFVHVTEIESTADMFDAVTKEAKDAAFVFKAAAVSDYTPAVKYDDKVKKKDDDMSIQLERTKDILMELGKNRRPGQVLCGFSMETRDLLENSTKKLEKKNADIIVANNLKVEGAGFGTDTNVITIITKKGHRQLEKVSKFEAAEAVVDEAMKIRSEKLRSCQAI